MWCSTARGFRTYSFIYYKVGNDVSNSFQAFVFGIYIIWNFVHLCTHAPASWWAYKKVQKHKPSQTGQYNVDPCWTIGHISRISVLCVCIYSWLPTCVVIFTILEENNCAWPLLLPCISINSPWLYGSTFQRPTQWNNTRAFPLSLTVGFLRKKNKGTSIHLFYQTRNSILDLIMKCAANIFDDGYKSFVGPWITYGVCTHCIFWKDLINQMDLIGSLFKTQSKNSH